MVVADQANLLAIIIDIANHDPRTTKENLVKTVFKLFEESGWIQTRGQNVNGQVQTSDDNGEVSVFDTISVERVLDQLRSGIPVVEVRQGDGISFLNVQNHRVIKVVPEEENAIQEEG